MCHFFDDLMRAWDMDIDTDFNGILLDEKLYKEKNENILIHDFATIRIDSYSSLPIGKILTFHNVIILIKLVVSKYENNYCYNIFFRKSFV